MATFTEPLIMETPESTESIPNFTQDFLSKINRCIKPGSSNHWIVQDIINGSTAFEIATKYLDRSDYDGDFLTSTTDGLLDAFITFKENRSIDPSEAAYLANRAGGLGQCFDDEFEGRINLSIFSVRDLIRELDGSEFDDWLINSGKTSSGECSSDDYDSSDDCENILNYFHNQK